MDSLAHLGLAHARDAIYMLAAVEQAFEIRLGDSERQFETVGDLHRRVRDKLAARGDLPDDLWPRLCRIIAHETGAPAGRITEATEFLDDTPPPGNLAILGQAVAYLAALGALAALFGWLGRAWD
ncbi:MAG: hypothetical protein QM698_09775 [Micropepsaceae bacterium]